jgi:hypothetical protein
MSYTLVMGIVMAGLVYHQHVSRSKHQMGTEQVKLIIFSVLLAVGLPNVMAHTEAYIDGYSMGYNNAVNNISIDANFLNSHSEHWQTGFWDGWNAGSSITNQQSQSRDVNIRDNMFSVQI